LLVAGARRLGPQEISFCFLGRQAWPKSSILRFDLVPSTRWIRAHLVGGDSTFAFAGKGDHFG